MKEHGRHDGARESFYNMLGVSRDADASEIKSAYRNLMADLDSESAEDMFLGSEAKKAYSVLKDKNMRMRYNNTLDTQAGYETDEGGDAAVVEGETALTVYTIDSRGNWFTEKMDRGSGPAVKGSEAYVLHLDEKREDIISKELWNRWRDLCAIWRSKDVIKGNIGDVSLDVDLISAKNGRLEYTRTRRKVSQLPVVFPRAVGELGEVYAYKNEDGEVMIVEQYDWMHLRRIMEHQSRPKYENIGM